MTELTYLEDNQAEISNEAGVAAYRIILDVEKHNNVDYITLGYHCSEDNVMLTRAEAEHLREYLNKMLG